MCYAATMPVDVATYRLSLRGQPVGTHVLRREEQGSVTALEGEMQLQGSLGALTTIQRSRTHRRRFHSLSFVEEMQRRGERRSFEVEFDAKSGLVTARRGDDEASLPYLLPYRDPLGLLEQLRAAATEEERPEWLRVPMLGKDVVAQHVGETEIDSIYGPRSAHAFVLHPGGSFVYVDAEAPHQILQMTQRIEGGWLDVQLQKIGQEASMPSREDEGGKRRRGKRRRRRRRGRRGGSSS